MRIVATRGTSQYTVTLVSRGRNQILLRHWPEYVLNEVISSIHYQPNHSLNTIVFSMSLQEKTKPDS